jgi:hypothetical protein
MKLHAENRLTVTKELFREGMLRISRDSYGKFAAKSMLVFGGIWVALTAFTLFTGGRTGTILFSLAIVVLIGIWLCWWTPRSNAKRAWEAQRSRYGDTILRVTRFYDDHLEITGDCADRTVSYADIKEIKHSDHLILLVGCDKVGILLSRDGFTTGDENTIVGLIGGNKLNG